MAAAASEQQSTTAPTEPQAAPGASREETPSQPVEMADLDPKASVPTDTPAGSSPQAPESAVAAAASTGDPRAAPAPTPSANTPSQPTAENRTSTTAAPLNRSETAELALGPDGSAPVEDSSASSTPTLRITLMLTTGARHAYTISQKYLTARKVDARDGEGNFEPREMSGYKLKELIWTDWRPEWEPRPRDPSSIRLIIMGRMMDDKVALKDLPFTLAANNVVHMTIKPADFTEDEAEGASKGGKGSIRAHNAGDEGGAGCRCIIL